MLAEILADTVAAHEFDKPCNAMLAPHDCGESAAWAVWVSHNAHHEPADYLICDTHKRQSEADWILVLGDICDCGFHFAGQLSANYRAIRL